MKDIVSIYIRKRRNMYEVTVKYVDEYGKTKEKCYQKFKRKKEAEKYLIEIKSSVNKNKFKLPNDLLFIDRCYKYYKDKEHEYSPKTINNAYSMIRKHVEPFWKNTKLLEVTISMYQDYMNYLGKLQLSDATIKKIYQITNAVLRESYRLQEINTNIPDFVVKPKTTSNKNKNLDIYSLDEIHIILKECKNTKFLEIPLNLFAFAGMRFGEIAGLCWEDVDFENNILNINKNLVFVDKKFYMRKPKTENGIRSIIVPNAVMELLKAEKLRQSKLILQGIYKKNKYDVVCLNTEFGYLALNNFLQSYKRFLKRYNLRYLRPHKLRHAHATLLLLSGTDMKTVSERLGHSKIEITMDTYSHVLKEMDQKASDNIERLLL